MRTPGERREMLKAVYEEARDCTRCPLHRTRTTVVFGAGNADAQLMFIGEAPGANEDRLGLPFVGQAGKLLDKLLVEIGLDRRDVFIANTLKCLTYDARVQLGDGSWERIGRLVRSRYGGAVMSVDAGGRIVKRRVTGWHATPRAGRPMFKLTFRSARPNGSSVAGVQLTGDHPVLTERGYLAVQDLRDGDRIATGLGGAELLEDLEPSLQELDARALAGGDRTERISFDRFSFARSDSAAMYDDVVAEDISDHVIHDTTLFCIDVEETHNFVTAGGVVHNCRPPDNRDPHPNEIEACHDYLRRQVDLIEPTVICTLGNFATKLLRADNTGISRLHGSEQELVIGQRAVRLYPLYHPAAALYTPSTLEALRADFQRIPDLLALGPPPQPDFGPEPDFGPPLDADPASPPAAEPETDLAHAPAADRAATPSASGAAAPEAERAPAQLGLF